MLFLFTTLIALSPLLTPTEAGYGRSPPTQTNTQNELRNSENIAQWSAQSAVANSAGNDYAQQLQTTQQYTNQFTAPVTKEQTGQAFNSVLHQQQASLVSAALANAQGAISRGAQSAAKSNFDQAYAQKEGDRLSGRDHDQGQLDSVYNAGIQQSQRASDRAQRAHYDSIAKTRQTRIQAAAIQALQGIQNVDQNASYGK